MDIGISDTRNIMEFLTDLKGFDFSNYSVILVKHRIESFMRNYSCSGVSHLLEFLTDDTLYLDKFVQYLACGSTEMFRDPSFWLYLKDNVLPKIFQRKSAPLFWIPGCVSGDEVYSLCYLLQNYQSDYSIKIEAGCYTQLAVSQIQNGIFFASKIDASSENAKAVLGGDLFFAKNDKEEVIRDKRVVGNVDFSICRLSGNSKPSAAADFILCRNRLLNYNINAQQRIVQHFYENLAPAGYLAVGIKEHPEVSAPARMFKTVSELECVFQKM